MKQIDSLSIATIRSLVIDITNKANSGHPGMAIGSASILYDLFTRHLVSNPKDSKWINRDRFVLSAGHASALLYSMLHLCNFKVSLDDLKSFRQLGSNTPGHPEYRDTDGVDATSGPLGQGISQAVGMAMAESRLNAFNPDLINHYTYVLCGDGCLHEGVSQEAISLAGHQKLNKLILFYDANEVTLDGGLSLSFSEDVKARFVATGWNVLEVLDGQDIDSIDEAIVQAKKSKDKPTMIMVHTVIGYGSAKQGTSKVHGSPLGVEDGKHAKVDVYGFDHEDFYIPQEVYDNFRETFVKRGEKAYEEYVAKNVNALKDVNEFVNLDVDKYLDKVSYEFVEGSSIATRTASGKVLNAYSNIIPNLFGGSADVAGSVMTKLDNGTTFDPANRIGQNVNWGIREFAMSSAQNGVLLHGGLRTYVGCFCVFADYMKAAIRLAALSRLPAIYLFSHDTIALGEDGPTHQPVEQLAMLRSIPNMNVVRPCDERETLGAWKLALRSKLTPTAIVTSRQKLPLLVNSSVEEVEKGAYVISKEKKNAQAILLATGSEVALSIEAQAKLAESGIDVRVVSMPCWEAFEKQSKDYKSSVLSLDRSKIVSVEMLSTFGWDKYAAYHMGIDEFGASAPEKDVLRKFDFNSDRLVNIVKEIIK